MNFDQQNREAFRKFVAGWEERLKRIEARLDALESDRSGDTIISIDPGFLPPAGTTKRGPGRPRKNPEQGK